MIFRGYNDQEFNSDRQNSYVNRQIELLAYSQNTATTIRRFGNITKLFGSVACHETCADSDVELSTFNPFKKLRKGIY